ESNAPGISPSTAHSLSIAALVAAPSNTITFTLDGFQPTTLTTTVGSAGTWINATPFTHPLVSGEVFQVFLPFIAKSNSSQLALAQAPLQTGESQLLSGS